MNQPPTNPPTDSLVEIKDGRVGTKITTTTADSKTMNNPPSIPVPNTPTNRTYRIEQNVEKMLADALKGIIANVETIKPENAEPWYKIVFKPGLTVSSKNLSDVHQLNPTTYLHNQIPGLKVPTKSCVLFPASDSAIINFLGDNTISQQFLASLKKAYEAKEITSSLVLTLCKTDTAFYLLAATQAPSTQPAGIIVRKWEINSGNSSTYITPSLVDWRTYFNILIPTEGRGPILYMETQDPIYVFRHWYFWELDETDARLTLLEACLGYFDRDKDVVDEKSVIIEENFNFTCNPEFK